ncbi:MAG: DUF1566 domain-containing protein, partial [Gammaproteobacteria bacterium]|nr:DUF1566 domain-containing protein [Gammaproteobacteria bacterium]
EVLFPQDGPESREIHFAKGETEKLFTVILSNDEFYEGPESLTFLVFNNPKGEIQSTLNLPINDDGRESFTININESRTFPAIEINKIKKGNNSVETLAPGTTNISVNENESLEIFLSTGLTGSSLPINVQFSLIPGVNVFEDIDYGFPFPENRLNPGDFTSNLNIEAKQTSFSFFLPIYTKTVAEAPKTITFNLIGAENAAITSSNISSLSITINDDGNNGIALNDTGINTCVSAPDPFQIDCGDPGFPNQDGLSNIDPQFSKFQSVVEAPALTPPNPDPAVWNCVYDHNTGLLWEVPTILDPDAKFTWFDENPTTNGGDGGTQIETDDGSTVAATQSTQNHANALNSPGDDPTIDERLCKVAKWRLPKLNELLSIMDFENTSTNLFVNTDYFKVYPDRYYWTATPSAISKKDAWCVYFGKIITDSVKLCEKAIALPVIMVSTVEIIPQ